MLHTNIESSFFSSSSSGFVDVLLFSGDGLKEYCVDDRKSDESLVEAVGSALGRESVAGDVGNDILKDKNTCFQLEHVNTYCDTKKLFSFKSATFVLMH